MPGYPETPFPERPFYSCEDDGLAVVDQSHMAAMLRGGAVDAWFRLVAGPGNAIESTPVKVERQDGPRVSVRCESGTVEIDFAEETIRKTDSNGRTFVYMGPIDEANDGNGWMAVR